jgi:hypothetical protein
LKGRLVITIKPAIVLPSVLMEAKPMMVPPITVTNPNFAQRYPKLHQNNRQNRQESNPFQDSIQRVSRMLLQPILASKRLDFSGNNFDDDVTHSYCQQRKKDVIPIRYCPLADGVKKT